MSYYFAYGSNMNPARMTRRGLEFVDVCPGRIEGLAMRFNKVSRHNREWACANLVYAPGEQVEGVLYRLVSTEEITKLDSFEGTPRYYNRDRFPVHTDDGFRIAWTYIANPGVVDNNILPLRWYVEQLLEGAAFLSEEYVARLRATPCREEDHAGWG